MKVKIMIQATKLPRIYPLLTTTLFVALVIAVHMPIASLNVGNTESVRASPLVFKALRGAVAIEGSRAQGLTHFRVYGAESAATGGIARVSSTPTHRVKFVLKGHANFARKTFVAHRPRLFFVRSCLFYYITIHDQLILILHSRIVC